jgi:glycolate oxidase iron-sulfur subunit
MNKLQYSSELLKCVRCGACKSFCPTYLSALDETLSARGRIALLGALTEKKLPPTKELSDKIYSCVLCEACKDLCPTGINISEVIYHGRTDLKNFYRRGRFLRTAMKLSSSRTDSLFVVLKGLYKSFYPLLYKKGKLRYLPDLAPKPFKESVQVYKCEKKIGRVALFVGCSVNYLFPYLGDALLHILIAKGYEVVILKGEVCCGAPMRAEGLEEEAVTLAKKNIELFSKMRVESILTMCPTCTMVIKNQYPLFAGGTIEKIMDVNEFFAKKNINSALKSVKRVVTYHDPCHLRNGLNIKDEPREVLKGIQGIDFVEMQNAEECCGFGGFFSLYFKDLSKNIGEKKMRSIHNTGADTLVTSCPGCIMQLEDIKRKTGDDITIMHIVEVLAEAMQE